MEKALKENETEKQLGTPISALQKNRIQTKLIREIKDTTYSLKKTTKRTLQFQTFMCQTQGHPNL